MLILFTKWTVVAFGIFLILVGFLMLFIPKIARATLRKAGSTNFINYTEITLRMIPAIALILYADFCRYPEFFKLLGWFMLATSIVLYFVPPKYHHNFSNKAADILKPTYVRLIFPFSMLFGGFVLYCVF
jgi:uncharacterized membrane protein YfcA